MTQLERRRIEAGMPAAVYETLCERLGRDEALAVVAATTERAAREAGRAFAQDAPRGPCPEHFATVADVWKAGGALDLEDERLEGGAWSFAVTRCAYAHMYVNEMGLPSELAFALSCGRDAAFAEGYSPALRLERSPTIAQGNARCLFRFVWDVKGGE